MGFDYSSGVLTFPNNVPASLTTNDIYIEGYRYIGPMGVSGGGSSRFIDLTDCPSAYVANSYVKVNSSGTGMIFDTSVPSFIGKGSQYFTANLTYSAGNLTTVTPPTGWTVTIDNAPNGDMTFTHNVGWHPVFVCAFGLATALGSTTWRLRTPSSQFEIRYDTTQPTKFQIMRASWAYTGADSTGSANLHIFF